MSNLSTKVITEYDDNMLIKIIELLNNNYVEDNKNNYRYVYTIDFIKWFLNKPSVIIIVEDNNTIIGTVMGRIIPTIIKGNNINMAEISFLCVIKEYRHNNITHNMINNIEQTMINMGADDAIFSTHHNMGKSLCESSHYIRLINIKKLVAVGYLRCDTTIDVIENHYKIDKIKNNNKRLEKITDNNIEDAFHLYCSYYKQFDLYTDYTLDQFKKVMLNDNIIGYVLIVNDIIVDFISYFIISSKVLRRGVDMHDGYIYHYTNHSNNIYRLMTMLLNIISIDTITIPNIMGININEFEDMKFVPTTTDHNYYLFRNKEIVIPKDKMGIFLL